MYLPQNSELLVRLEAKTVKDKCWLWQGQIDGGYGRISINDKLYAVHRLSAYIYLGYNITDEIYQVLHNAECPNRNCWNPDHLHIGTNTDNHAERQPKSHCINGHEYTPENTRINIKGRKECKICRRESTQQHRQRKYGTTTTTQ